MRVLGVLGGAQLDLRDATFSARDVVITINAFMGGAEIVVGPETDVVLEGTAIMGGYAGPDRRHARIGPGSPRVRVRGFAFWGGVSVTRRP
jgi:predicted membrane protein